MVRPMSGERTPRGRRTALAMFLIKSLCDREAVGGFYGAEMLLGSDESKDVIWIKDLGTGEVLEISVKVCETGT